MTVPFTNVPDGDIDPESVIDTPLMTALRDNPAAIAEGAVGAPRVQNAALAGYPWGAGDFAPNSMTAAEIAPNAIGQSELKTTISNQSITINASSAATITPTGGDNTTNWFVGMSPSSSGRVSVPATVTPSAVAVYNADPSAGTYYMRSTYVQASPPYDLGDGTIPLFVYALIDNTTGDIIATSVAQDPPWAYNSSVDITPQRIDAKGRAYRFEREKPQSIAAVRSIRDAMKMTQVDRDLFMAWERGETPVAEVEITMSYKNKGMPERPHPFETSDLSGRTIVLFDPLNDGLMLDLTALNQSRENIAELIHEGGFIIDNTALSRISPPGVMLVAVRWKQFNNR